MCDFLNPGLMREKRPWNNRVQKRLDCSQLSVLLQSISLNHKEGKVNKGIYMHHVCIRTISQTQQRDIYMYHVCIRTISCH